MTSQIVATCSYTGIAYAISSPVIASPRINLVHPHFILPQKTLTAIAFSQYKRISHQTTDALILNTWALIHSTKLLTFQDTLSPDTKGNRRLDIANNLELLLRCLTPSRFRELVIYAPHMNIYADTLLSDILDAWCYAESTGTESQEKQKVFRKLAASENSLSYMLDKGRNKTTAFGRKVSEYLGDILGTPLCSEWQEIITLAITGKHSTSVGMLNDAQDLLEFLETSPLLADTYSTYYATAIEALRRYCEDTLGAVKYGDVSLKHVRYDLLGLDTVAAPLKPSEIVALASGIPALVPLPPVRAPAPGDYPDKISYLIALARFKG